MFCPECGEKCQPQALFCANCGTRLLISEPVVVAPLPPIPTPAPAAAPSPNKTKDTEPRAEGVILTNLAALSRKLGVERDALKRLLDAYIDASRVRGMEYQLIDASDYLFLDPQTGGGRRESLSPQNSWIDHIYLLADHYRYGRRVAQEQTNYLFIIGGADVIPMPIVPHYVAEDDFSDEDIESDIPYAYLLGKQTFEKLLTSEIFQYEQYFHVGRLPLASDAIVEDLLGYLRRAAHADERAPMRSFYAQTDLTWLGASAMVSEPLRRYGLSSCVAPNTDSRLAAREIFITPSVDTSTISRLFSPSADLYFFNLHGSDAPSGCSFYACYKGSSYEAISPRQLASIERPNIVVTEACYGGKFRDYRRNETMLLAAMGANTLLYLGSSRIAWGVSDCSSTKNLNHADRLTHVFMNRLLEGCSAGESLYLARQSFFDCEGDCFDPSQAATLVEFNLYGDPWLGTTQQLQEAKSQTPGVKKLTHKPINSIVESKCLYKSGGQSLLDQVRGAVDQNLAKIRATIDKQLYEQLGVEPRQLHSIILRRYAGGEQQYAFDYVEQNGAIKQLYKVTTDKSGTIESIIMTK